MEKDPEMVDVFAIQSISVLTVHDVKQAIQNQSMKITMRFVQVLNILFFFFFLFFRLEFLITNDQ